MELAETIDRVADLLCRADKVVALTGAGISVESGIPDFRSPQGLWHVYPPEEYATIQAFRANPAKVWRMLNAMDELIQKASPNPAHRALARLEELGRLSLVVTQNIDGLHQLAGSRNVVEFHGSARRLVCPDCGRQATMDEVQDQGLPPRCVCGGFYKSDVVLFGEAIPEDAIRTSLAMASICQVMLVVGTSAVVAPASHLPLIAKQGGAKVVEVNLTPTPLTDGITDYFLPDSAGPVLTRLVTEVESRLGRG